MLLFQKEFRCLWIGQQIFVAVTWLDRAAISKRKHSSTCKVWVVGNQENVLCALIKSSVVKATDFHVSLIFVHLTFKVIIHDYPEELSIDEIKEVYGSHCTNQLLWNSLVYLRPKSGPRPRGRGRNYQMATHCANVPREINSNVHVRTFEWIHVIARGSRLGSIRGSRLGSRLGVQIGGPGFVGTQGVLNEVTQCSR